MCSSQVWPLSLLAFHSSVHSLSLSPRPLPPDTAACGQLLQRDNTKKAASTQGDSCHGNGRTQQQLNGEEAAVEMTTNETIASGGVAQAVVSPLVSALSSVRDGQLLQLDHCYRRHVKPKKQHEIMTLAPVCGNSVDIIYIHLKAVLQLNTWLGSNACSCCHGNCDNPKLEVETLLSKN